METRQFEPIVEMRDVGLRYGDNPEVLKNIDNGFGAGYLANMINHMEVKG